MIGKMRNFCIERGKIVHKYTENGYFSIMPNHAKVRNAYFTGVSGIFPSRSNTNYTELGGCPIKRLQRLIISLYTGM